MNFLTGLLERMKENGADSSNSDVVEAELVNTCKTAVKKDEKFCYYIGASSISATRLVNEVTRPLSNGVPPSKICHDRLRKKDAQICELAYDKEIDLSTVDLSKLRVRDLRKILTDMGEVCSGCVEKSEFVSKIRTVAGLKSEL